MRIDERNKHVLYVRETFVNRSRDARQAMIREIVRAKPIRTQQALVAELKNGGFPCTQATVSRDIAEMGLSKLSDGNYMLAGDLHLRRMLSSMALAITRVNNLVLVKGSLGSAQAITAAIDEAELPEVAGTIAGDDTILVVTVSDEAGESLVSRLEKLRCVS